MKVKIVRSNELSLKKLQLLADEGKKVTAVNVARKR